MPQNQGVLLVLVRIGYHHDCHRPPGVGHTAGGQHHGGHRVEGCHGTLMRGGEQR